MLHRAAVCTTSSGIGAVMMPSATSIAGEKRFAVQPSSTSRRRLNRNLALHPRDAEASAITVVAAAGEDERLHVVGQTH